MNPEMKKRWVDALRNEKYYIKGSGGFLKEVKGSKISYCGLGVLCDLWINSMGGAWVFVSYAHYSVRIDSETYDKNGYLPEPIAKSVGLDIDPLLEFEGEKVPFTRLNDQGLSFNQLADLIEEQL